MENKLRHSALQLELASDNEQWKYKSSSLDIPRLQSWRTIINFLCKRRSFRFLVQDSASSLTYSNNSHFATECSKPGAPLSVVVQQVFVLKFLKSIIKNNINWLNKCTSILILWPLFRWAGTLSQRSPGAGRAGLSLTRTMSRWWLRGASLSSTYTPTTRESTSAPPPTRPDPSRLVPRCG